MTLPNTTTRARSGTRAVERRTRTRGLATSITAALAVVAGMLVAPPPASALGPQKQAIARWKIGNSGSYDRLIASIAAHVNIDPSPSVPGTSTNVFHTSARAVGIDSGYFHVEVEQSDSQDFVTLRLRASDLYLVGWWGNDRGHGNRSRYYAVERGQLMPPDAAKAEATTTPFGGSYTDLERWAGGESSDRGHMTWGSSAMNNAVETLIRGDIDTGIHRRNMARAFLRMTQTISEAARFVPLATWFRQATATDYHTPPKLDGRYVSMENRWGEFSRHYNEMEGKGISEPADRAVKQFVQVKNPTTGRYEWRDMTFNTMISFALYLLKVSLGPKTK